jgi:hypothetical protein
MQRGLAPVQKYKTLDKMITARKYWLSGEDMAELEIKAGDKFFVPWPFSYVYINDENMNRTRFLGHYLSLKLLVLSIDDVCIPQGS